MCTIRSIGINLSNIGLPSLENFEFTEKDKGIRSLDLSRSFRVMIVKSGVGKDKFSPMRTEKPFQREGKQISAKSAETPSMHGKIAWLWKQYPS